MSRGSESGQNAIPASDSDLFLYKGITTSYACNALQAGLEFSKAVGIASATYTQVLTGRHGSRLSSVGPEKLSNKELFDGSELQVLSGAMEFCPTKIPNDIRKKLKKALDKVTKK